MALSETKKGEFIILAESLLYSSFPVVVKLTYGGMPPLATLAWATAVSAVFFSILLTVKKRWHEIASLAVWRESFYVAILIGVVFWSIYFFGLKYTTAGNASLVSLIEIFFNFLFFHIIKKHHIPKSHAFGALLMVLGAAIILFPKHSGLMIGDWIIVSGYLFTPLGNYFQQRLRKSVSSEAILFLRSILSLPFLFFLTVIFRQPLLSTEVNRDLILLLINGIVMFGICKVLWIEAIHRLSITKSSALSSVTPMFTLLFSFWLLHEAPRWWQFMSFVPLFFGIIMLTSGHKQEGILLPGEV